MSEFAGVIGYFESGEALKVGIEGAKEAQLAGATAYLPLPDDAEIHAMEPSDSPVRWFALIGGLTGIATALFLTIWCSWNYPLVVGGKSITSWPPFLVICFELMVLFGSFGALTGFLILSKLPHVRPEDGYAPAVAVDTFGLFIPCRPRGGHRIIAENVLHDAGAEDVRSVYR